MNDTQKLLEFIYKNSEMGRKTVDPIKKMNNDSEFQKTLDRMLSDYDEICTEADRLLKESGVGEASGMFPYDEEQKAYDPVRVAQFNDLIASKNLPWTLLDIMPTIYQADMQAGCLSPEGAALLDETGTLEAGIPMCPPEGDAGTGMVATNAVAPRTGSVSAGTSSFALLVLDKPMKGYYTEIDVACTPAGKTVASCLPSRTSSLASTA